MIRETDKLHFYAGKDWSLSFSEGLNPLLNLAWENYLLQGNFPTSRHLFLYRNDKCVVSGRFQVPWKEMNFNHSDFQETAFIRRRSGGGTVYHDPGNWNFCFLNKDREILRQSNLRLVQEVLGHLGVAVEINERYDLVFRDNSRGENQLRKVSGSAFKQKKDMALHHGTLLVNAQLKSLKGLLGSTDNWDVQGKGIASVPSPVTNLGDHPSGRDLTFDKWLVAWQERLDVTKQDEYHLGANEEVAGEAKTLASWDWRWGETPRHKIYFHVRGPKDDHGHAEESWVEIHKGVINACRLKSDSISGRERLNQLLCGQKVCSLTQEQFEELDGQLERVLEPRLKEELSKLLTYKKRLLLI